MLEQHSYGHFACMRASSCVSRSLLACERVIELPFCKDVNEADDIALPKVYLKIPPDGEFAIPARAHFDLLYC